MTANAPEENAAVASAHSSRALRSGPALSAESTPRLAVETLNELGILVTGSPDPRRRLARKLGGSEQQIRDVVGVLMVQGPELDRGYIEGWVDRLGVRDEWDQALALERRNN